MTKELDPTQNETEEVTTEAPERPESMEESIRASMAEIGDGDEAEADKDVPGDEGKEAEKPTLTASEAASILAKSKGQKGKRREVIEAKDLEPEGAEKPEKAPPPRKIDPPARWSVEKKEWFNRLPLEAKEEIEKGWGDIESGAGKLVQETHQLRQRYESTNQVLDHYLPELHKAGVHDLGKFTAEMVSTWKSLRTPAERDATIANIIRVSGADPGAVAAHLRGQVPAQQNQHSPQNAPLTMEQVEEIIARREQSQQEQRQQAEQFQALQSAQAEIASLTSETGTDGRYLYPELHDPEYRKRVTPLVDYIVSANPAISWKEATKRAVLQTRQLDGKVAPLTSPTRPSQEEIQRARAASVSIRGRGNGAVAAIQEAPKHEKMEDSIRASMAVLQRTS